MARGGCRGLRSGDRADRYARLCRRQISRRGRRSRAESRGDASHVGEEMAAPPFTRGGGDGGPSIHTWGEEMAAPAGLLPGEPQGRGSLGGCRLWGRAESGTTERLALHFSLSCTGEGNGSPLQGSCLESPRDGGAWVAAACGVAQSRARLSDLAVVVVHTWGENVKVTRSCPALCDPVDYAVHGILQARILEWVAVPFSRGSSQPRDSTQVSCIAGGLFTN